MSFHDPMLNKSVVSTLLGCSERTLERRVREQLFPAPVQFGRDSMWFESVVHKWLQAQLDEQLLWKPKESKAAKSKSPVNGDGSASRSPRRRAQREAAAACGASLFTTEELSNSRIGILPTLD